MTVTQQVTNILQASRDARNSDRELIIIYMDKFGMELTEKQKLLFREMPSTETIRRIRQKLQEDGQYPAEENVDKARFEKHKEMRGSSIGGTEVIEQILNDGSVVQLPPGYRISEDK